MVVPFERERRESLSCRWWMFCCSLLWAVLPCSAQTVTIRVLNVNSGKPLIGQTVSVNFVYGSVEGTSGPRSLIRLTTNKNGEAEVSLPHPMPDHIWVEIKLTSEHWHCACQDLVPTAEVIQKGINVPEGVGMKHPEASHPGEVIFGARPFTFFEKLLYPFVKQ